MDNYLEKNRWKNYYLAMAQPYANSLKSTADFLSFIHLKDGFIQMEFQDDVKRFVDAKLEIIRNPRSSDEECNQCVQELKQELEYLNIQDRMLRSGEAALHASVQFIKSDKGRHWIINGVGVVLSGLQVVAGFGVIALSFRAGSIVGTGFGAMLVLHGLNGVQEGFKNIINDTNNAEGFLKGIYIAGAEFLGFDQKTGELAYTTMDLLLSAYGMVRLIRKPEAYRLFYYLNTDYVRGISNMSRFDLGVEIYNDSMAIKSIYDDIKND